MIAKGQVHKALDRLTAVVGATTLSAQVFNCKFMTMSEYSFLFSSLGSKQPNTTRKFHIRRLYDILQLCIQRQDWARAKRAWGILARCQEVDWKTMWRTSVLLLGEGNAEDDDTQANGDRVRFLSVMMRQHPGEVSGFTGP